jgi:hypothetical protein
MGNPKDFLAKQIRTNTLVVSGGNWAVNKTDGSSPGLLIYSASVATDFVGSRPDRVYSGSGNFGMVQIYQTDASLSGGFALANTYGGNVRIAFDEKMDILPHHATQRVTKAHILVASGANAVPFITFISGSSASPGGSGQRMFILSQSIGGSHPHTSSNTAANDPYNMLDVNFWVSGSKNSKRNDGSNGYCGTAVFGGDLVVSGTLYAEKQVIEVDLSRSGSLYVSGSAEIGGGLVVNEHGGALDMEIRSQHQATFFKADTSAEQILIYSGSSSTTLPSSHGPLAPLHIALRNDSPTGVNSALILEKMSATAISSAGIGTGILFRLETSDSNYEYVAGVEALTTTHTGGSEDAAIVFKTMTGGATRSEKFRIGADETVVNEGSIDHDFRVETNNEDEAFFVDGGNNAVYINKGESAVSTHIHSTNDIAITVAAAGVIINEDGNAANDFRVETDNKTHALFVDASLDQVLILTGAAGMPSSANMTDACFVVSGSKDQRGRGGTYGTAVFGGDAHFSGSVTVGGTLGSWTSVTSPHYHVIPASGDFSVGIGHGGVGNGITQSDIWLGKDGGAIFNQHGSGSSHSDFRIEGQNDANLFVVDVSTDSIGINVAAGSHGSRLDILANDASEVGLLVTNNPGSAAAMGDVAKFISGSVEVFSVGSTDVVINEGSATRDFRVESNADTHMLHVDGTNDGVSIGTSDPSSSTKLHIGNSSNSSAERVILMVENETASALDAQITFAKQGTAKHCIGMDDSDSDKFKISTGGSLGAGVSLIDLPAAAGGEIVFNEGHADIDFRIEGDTDTNLFVVDASADTIGINIAAGSHGAKLDILQDAASGKGLLVKNNPGSGAAAGDIAQFVSGSTEVFSVGAADVVINEGGTSRDFRVESLNQAGMLFVDASEDTVAIGTISVDSNASLHITHPQDSAAAILLIENESSGNAYDAQVSFAKNGTTAHSIGMDDSDSDKLRIAMGSALGASNKALMDFPSATGGAIVVNEDGQDHDFRIETTNDTKAFLVDAGNDVVVINENGDGVDFRVETAAEDEAFFVDSSANIVYVNKGETAVTTIIGSTNDEAIRVGAAGVIFNEDGHATNDFRVESDSKDHAFWVDSGANFVSILTGSEAITGNTKGGTDVCFFVSGSNDKDTQVRGVSVFGGDVVVSGTIYDKSGNSLTNNYGKMAVLDSSGNTEGTSTAAGLADTFKLKEGSGIGLSINAGSDQVTISANFGSATNPAFTDRGFRTGHVENHRGTSIICTSSIAFVSGNHIGGVSPVAYDASNVGQDVFFFVSGSVGGETAAAAHRHGVSCFGGDMVVSGALATKSNFKVNGNTNLKGNTALGNANSDTITFTGRVNSHVLPSADSTYNLGSAALRFANIYTGDLHLRNDRGNWTIYEEPDMLVVVNNLTGKKYKMGLTPLEDDE